MTDLDNLFSYHPPKGDQAQRYERLRSAARAFSEEILEGVPMPALTDPTGEASTRRDPALAALERIRKRVRDAHRAIDDAVHEASKWQARGADGYERMTTSNSDPGCKSCARLTVACGKDHRGRDVMTPRWEPVHHNVTIHDEKHPVCQWCGRWVKDTGELPSRDVLQAHHEGRRITRRAS